MIGIDFGRERQAGGLVVSFFEKFFERGVVMKKSVEGFLVAVVFFINFFITVGVAQCEDPPVCKYSCEGNVGVAPFDLSCTDESTGAITSYEWDIQYPTGEVKKVFTKDLEYTFNEPGGYGLGHWVYGPGGSQFCYNPPNVIVMEVLADVEASTTEGATPLRVQFFDTVTASTGVKILLRKWDFGDGRIGFGTNPTHTYRKAGEYTVDLTVYYSYEGKVGAGGWTSYDGWIVVHPRGWTP